MEDHNFNLVSGPNLNQINLIKFKQEKNRTEQLDNYFNF